MCRACYAYYIVYPKLKKNLKGCKMCCMVCPYSEFSELMKEIFAAINSPKDVKQLTTRPNNLCAFISCSIFTKTFNFYQKNYAILRN